MIEEELEKIELITRKINRSEYLIAQFIDGFAAGWAFAVKDAFRDALDIKLTNKTINKKIFQIYTQGQNFKFNQGDSFYNDKSAYKDWLSFLKGENPISLEVHSSTSSGFETKETFESTDSPLPIMRYEKNKKNEGKIKSLKVITQAFNAGTVIVKVYMPNKEKTSVVEKEALTLKQDEFVMLLQTGSVYINAQQKYVSFKFKS